MSVPASEPAVVQAPVNRDTRASGARAASGLIAGAILLALLNAGAIAARVPLAHGGVPLRLAHHAFDFAETLGVGALFAAAVGGFSALVRLPAWALFLVYTGATGPILIRAFDDQIQRQAPVSFEGRFTTPILIGLTLLVSVLIPLAHFIGAFFSRYPRLRPIPIVLAIAAIVGNHLYLADDYFGAHGAITWIAVTIAGAAFAPLAERAAISLLARPRGRAALIALGLVAALGVLVPPSNAVRVELFRHPTAIATWALSATLWRAPHPRTPSLPPDSPWLRDRSALPDVPPTTPRPTPPSPVVVLITVDATRAEAINNPDNDALFPTLTAMKRRGAWFTQASSPGGQTAVSLSTTFSGRYFSELAWGMHGSGAMRFLYPADDPAPRFPALLTAAGVQTATFCSINFLAGHYGVARGFKEERVVPEGRRHALGKQMIDPVLERLRRGGAAPLFLYTHLMEPHSPYDRGRKDGTPYERYLSEITLADAQIARVWRVLEQRFAGRAILIVSADHGEAFGEHQTHEHTKTLYEELLRVPLLIRGAGIPARKITERVGLIDVGPTILDLFGVGTPATFNGQSLVPLLTGQATSLDRPLLAEGRLRRALYTRDGLKVIHDPRRKIVEVFDLERDPAELHNLWDEDPARSDRALGLLEAFFATHTLEKPGYRTPYKP